VSSLVFLNSKGKERCNAIVSLYGAAVWALFALLAGLRRAPFGIIELLFLFAPLVIVPLGLELTRRLTGVGSSRVAGLTPVLQILATIAVSVAFWLPPGRTAAALSVAWLFFGLFLTADRFLQSRTEARTGLSLILNLAYLDLILGAAWLVTSRAGVRPMGFQEPIVLLTAVHFHYSGFATALIAAATLREFRRRNLVMHGVRVLIWLVVLLPFLLAAGFVFSPLLRFVAAIALATCVTALAMILLWFAGEFHSGPARVFLRAACCAALAGFSLAGIYAVSEYFDRDWITVPGMANSHGVLNGLGFVLFALLAWLMELQEGVAQDARESDQVRVIRGTRSTVAFARSTGTAGLHPSQSPEFVARDFYDR
jgi:YndJ-like protein